MSKAYEGPSLAVPTTAITNSTVAIITYGGLSATAESGSLVMNDLQSARGA